MTEISEESTSTSSADRSNQEANTSVISHPKKKISWSSKPKEAEKSVSGAPTIKKPISIERIADVDHLGL